MIMPFDKEARWGRFADPLLMQLYEADWLSSGLLEKPKQQNAFFEKMADLKAAALARIENETRYVEAKWNNMTGAVVEDYRHAHERAVQDWNEKLAALKKLSPNVVSLIEFYDYLNEKLKRELMKLEGLKSVEAVLPALDLIYTHCDAEFTALFLALNEAFSDKFSLNTASFLQAHQCSGQAFFKNYFKASQVALSAQTLPLSETQLYGFFYLDKTAVSEQGQASLADHARASVQAHELASFVLPGAHASPLFESPPETDTDDTDAASVISVSHLDLRVSDSPLPVSPKLKAFLPEKSASSNNEETEPTPVAPQALTDRGPSGRSSPIRSRHSGPTVTARVPESPSPEYTPAPQSPALSGELPVPEPEPEENSPPMIKVLRPGSGASARSGVVTLLHTAALASEAQKEEAQTKNKESGSAQQEEESGALGRRLPSGRRLGSTRYPHSSASLPSRRPLGRGANRVAGESAASSPRLAGASQGTGIDIKPAAEQKTPSLYELAKSPASQPLVQLIEALDRIGYVPEPGSFRGQEVARYKESLQQLFLALQKTERVLIEPSSELSQFFSQQKAALEEKRATQPDQKSNLSGLFEAVKRGLIKRITKCIERLNTLPPPDQVP